MCKIRYSTYDCNLRLTSISRIPRLKTEMQPGFSQWGGQTPAQRLFAAGEVAMMGCGPAGSLLPARVRPCWGGIAADRPPLGRARGGGLVAQGRGGRWVVSLDAFFSSGCQKARFGALQNSIFDI